jgi:hypothetical protein
MAAATPLSRAKTKYGRISTPTDEDLSPGAPDFRHNPEGLGWFSPFRCRSSLQ